MDDDFLEPEFADPYKTWKAQPTPDTTTKFLKTINPVLTAALRSYGGQSSPTMHTRAKLMALDAAKRYDPTKSKLRTHLMFQLQGLRRQVAKEQQILSLPEQIALDLGHLREAENFLRDKHGRDPSDIELSDYMNVSPKRLTYIRKVKPAYAEGMLQRSTDEGEELHSPAIKDKDNIKNWHEFVYRDLMPIDQVIMAHTFGMHGRPVLSNQDIAKRLKITPGAVSQRKAKIQGKLDLRDEFRII